MPVHDARHYEITLVPSDTGTHLLGEVQTSWRLRSADPVAALLDSSMRVVRVLVDGKPNTRLSRTMYGRSNDDVVVPHQKQAGDSISTRIRYHGLVRGDAWIGRDRSGTRAFVAGGWKGSGFWLPVPAGPPPRVTAFFHVQAPLDQRAVANGTLDRVDTLPYNHATWHYRLDTPAPLGSLAVAVGRYAVTPLSAQVEVWTRPADSAWAVGATGPFRRAGAMLDSLSAILGPFPYRRLIHLATPAVTTPRSGGGLTLYPEERFRDGGIDERLVAAETARQWLDGADSVLATEISIYLAGSWAGESAAAFGRLEELRKELGDGRFRDGLRAFAESQRRGRGSAREFAAAMRRDR
jgi:hypothetical protein